MAVRNRIINTQTQDPLITLVETMFAGGIEEQERRGQRQLVASEVLPVDLNRGNEADYLALGFTFGEPVQGDPLFRAATLPKGWKREGSDHAMWSYIVDERGFRRVGIFYKAAFYDRSAHMGIHSVGRDTASEALYGDGPITADALRLALLTPDELNDFRAGLDRMRRDIRECPEVYGKYGARLEQADVLVAASSDPLEAQANAR